MRTLDRGRDPRPLGAAADSLTRSRAGRALQGRACVNFSDGFPAASRAHPRHIIETNRLQSHFRDVIRDDLGQPRPSMCDEAHPAGAWNCRPSVCRLYYYYYYFLFFLSLPFKPGCGVNWGGRRDGPGFCWKWDRLCSGPLCFGSADGGTCSLHLEEKQAAR